MASTIEKIFEKTNKLPLWLGDSASTDTTLALIKESAAEDITVNIVGGDFQLAATLNGLDAFLGYMSTRLIPKLSAILDPQKPSKREVVRVIAGEGFPWAAIELQTTGTTKKGKFLC
jgi:hypothetical protein